MTHKPLPEDRLGEAANQRAIYRLGHDLTQHLGVFEPGRAVWQAEGLAPGGQTFLWGCVTLLRVGDYQLTVEQCQSLSWPVIGQANLVPENPNNAANLQRKIK